MSDPNSKSTDILSDGREKHILRSDTAVVKTFPGYEYAICKNIGRSSP